MIWFLLFLLAAPNAPSGLMIVQESPDNTRMPPAWEIIDAQGRRFARVEAKAGDYAIFSQTVYANRKVWSLDLDGLWYVYTVGWNLTECRAIMTAVEEPNPNGGTRMKWQTTTQADPNLGPCPLAQ